MSLGESLHIGAIELIPARLAVEARQRATAMPLDELTLMSGPIIRAHNPVEDGAMGSRAAARA